MLNLRARQYEPAMNRFSQKDILKGSAWLPQSLNRYAFVMNDPVGLADPSGMFFSKLFKSSTTKSGGLFSAIATIGKVVGSATKAASSVASKVGSGIGATQQSVFSSAQSEYKRHSQNGTLTSTVLAQIMQKICAVFEEKKREDALANRMAELQARHSNNGFDGVTANADPRTAYVSPTAARLIEGKTKAYYEGKLEVNISDEKAHTAFNILTLGMWIPVKQRSDAMWANPSVYTVSNFLTLGYTETVNRALLTEKVGSLQHWVDCTSAVVRPMLVVSASTTPQYPTTASVIAQGTKQGAPTYGSALPAGTVPQTPNFVVLMYQ